jgi:carboxyl-terminal processing protease
MTGIDPVLARRKVIGPAKSIVVLTILRDGQEEPFDVSITRASISVPSVTYKSLERNIGYVKIINFGDKTTEELKTALKDLLKEKPAGIILDLRNNPGGGLTTAIETASQFLDQGVVLYEVYGDNTQKIHDVIPGGLATDVPLIVLVNQYSASASEVVAGAIQDAGRAILVGTQTYGKGTVQSWIPLSDDQGAVRITIAKWLTPNERAIHQQGLTPDVIVEMTTEDIQAQLDPQLDKAIELLLQK